MNQRFYAEINLEEILLVQKKKQKRKIFPFIILLCLLTIIIITLKISNDYERNIIKTIFLYLSIISSLVVLYLIFLIRKKYLIFPIENICKTLKYEIYYNEDEIHIYDMNKYKRVIIRYEFLKLFWVSDLFYYNRTHDIIVPRSLDIDNQMNIIIEKYNIRRISL